MIMPRRVAILGAVTLVHIGLILLVLLNKAMFISNQSQAPRIIMGYCFAFIGFSIFQIGSISFIRGLGIVEVIRTQLPYLSLPLFVCAALLLFQSLGGSSDSLGLNPKSGIPFLGKSPEIDETVVWSVSWFLTFSAAFIWMSGNKAPVQLDMVSLNPYEAVKSIGGARELVISQFVERASHLQRRSTYILLGIILMLICAAIFIVFAGQITSLDVSGVKFVSLAQADVRAAEDELDRISSDISRKQLQRRRAAKDAKDQATKEQSAKESSKAEISDDSFPAEAFSDDEISRLKFEAKKDALKKANEVLLRVKDKQFEDDRPKDQTSGQLLLIQTSVTRFGVVLILVFLVQILVSLYRYNMKLSAFYFGRADALVLLGRLPSNLRSLVDVISPDKLDFGKPPRTPADEAGGLLHAWTGARNARRDEPHSPKKK